MKRFAISLFVIFIIFVCSNAYAMKNDPDGFRGIKWETKISDLNKNEFTFDHTEENFLIYTRETDELKIGAAKLDVIYYIFWHDKLSGVFISGKGQSNFDSLLLVLQEKYGKGIQNNQFIPEYTWFGKKTYILIKYESFKNEFGCRLGSIKVGEENEKWEKDQAKKGAQNDL